MPSSDDQLIIAFREEMRAGFAVFATEMRDGFANFSTEMRDGFAVFASEMRDGLAQVSNRLDRTNDKLDQTNRLLLETRTEMSSKLSGISDFLIQSEHSHSKTDKRIDALESRVQKLENQKKRPS